MIIQMAGLPGTGKSALASALAGELPGVVLDKDGIRQALFTTAASYTREQDDFCVHVMFDAAAYLLAHGHGIVILDGRTCSRTYQVAEVRQFAARMDHSLTLIECVCAETTAHRRLAAGCDHPAANRDFDLYRQLRDAGDPIPAPKLLLDTDAAPDVVLARCLGQLRTTGVRPLPAGVSA